MPVTPVSVNNNVTTDAVLDTSAATPPTAATPPVTVGLPAVSVGRSDASAADLTNALTGADGSGNAVAVRAASSVTPADLLAIVTSSFNEILGRSADAAEIAVWQTELENLAAQGKGAVELEEHIDKALSESAEGLVRQSYLEVFDREPDVSGMAYWRPQVQTMKDQGKTPSAVLVVLVDKHMESAEFGATIDANKRPGPSLKDVEAGKIWSLGHTHADLKGIQRRFSQLGVAVPSTGEFDLATWRAVRDLRVENDLHDAAHPARSGDLGPSTYKKLCEKETAPRSDYKLLKNFIATKAVLSEGDRGAAVVDLQRLLSKLTAKQLGADGIMGKKTTEALREFQGDHGIAQNGMVGADTMKALDAAASGAGKKLSADDIKNAAKSINIPEACLRAVIDVECAGSGFLPSGRPVILFERHWFSDFTNGRYDRSRPDISSPNPGGYLGKEREWDRLNDAKALDETAALKSASWGLGQVMGDHYALCGYATVQAFASAMAQSEYNQLKAMCAFIQKNGLDRALRSRDWAGFARGYNGPNYKINEYDTKLAAAYARWA